MRVASIAVVALVMLFFPLTSAWPNAWNGHGGAYTTSSGIGWHYSAEEEAFFRTPTSVAVDSSGPELQWSFVPACTGNAPDGSFDACATAVCTTSEGEVGITFWLFSRPVTPPDSAWSLSGQQCMLGQERVDLADVEAEIRRIIEDRFREIAQPTVSLAPPAGGLVNLPVLAWTEDAGEVTLSFEQPLPGTVTASPTFEWAWSNGSTSYGPGIPYTESVSPTRSPDRYVHAVFDGDGDASVELTVTWTGQVTVPGLPPVEISPLGYTAPAAFAVREARTQLVAGDR